MLTDPDGRTDAAEATFSPPSGVQWDESSLWLYWDSRWYNGLGARFAGLDSFFFAWSFPSILCHLQGYLPASRKPQLLEFVGKMDKAVGDFFRGRLIIAFLMVTLFAIGWLFAGVPYWFLLGVGTGLLSIIPYAASVGWLLAILLKYLDLTTGEGSPDFAWVPVLVWPSLVYGLVQFFEGWVLTPWIQSESTNLSAVTILIVVLVGGVVGGLYGLILAIPIAACLKILAIEMLLPQLQQWATDN